MDRQRDKIIRGLRSFHERSQMLRRKMFSRVQQNAQNSAGTVQAQPDGKNSAGTPLAQSGPPSSVGSSQPQPDDQTSNKTSRPSTGDRVAITGGQWLLFLLIVTITILVVFNGSSTANTSFTFLTNIILVITLSGGILQFSPYLQAPVDAVFRSSGRLIDRALVPFSLLKSHFSSRQQTSAPRSRFLRQLPRAYWRFIWAIPSTALVGGLLLIELVHNIPHLPRYCGNILNGPTISYQSPTQEPIGISGDEACFDFEKDNHDNQDIEQLIYAQNQSYVPDTSQSHITLVVATSLTGSDRSSIAVGKVVLQGVLIRQKAYNEKAAQEHRPPLRLLVGNDGSNARYAKDLADKIVSLTENDKTILGVVGWPFSTLSTHDALTMLEGKGIVSISPTLSSNDFTGVYSHFFHIVSPDLLQGTDGALFAEEQWHPKKVVVFVDYGNPYSRSLATSFAAALEVKKVRVYFVKYTRDEDQAVVPGLVQKALSYGPNLIYFAGYANDFDPIRGNLSALQSSVPVMGGDGLYELGGYQGNNSNFRSIYFTTFASIYTITDANSKQPRVEPQPFSTDYSNLFDRLHLYPNAIDSGIAESDAILAYDAADVLLTAYLLHFDLHSDHPNVSSEVIYKALQNMKGEASIHGISGDISFGSDGTPDKKTILVLRVDDNQNTCIAAVYGTYREGKGQVPPPKEDIRDPVPPSPNCQGNAPRGS